MTSRVRRVTWALLGGTWLVSSCGSVDPKAETAATLLDDGVYLVMAPAPEAAEGATALAPGVVELETVPLKDEPVETMQVSTTPVVRLREMHVNGVHFDETNACELITFKNNEKFKLFTRGHVGSRLAVVIGGKVVSSHKVRVPLEDEEFQISFCTEGGGDHLYRHLREVYSYMPERHGCQARTVAPRGTRRLETDSANFPPRPVHYPLISRVGTTRQLLRVKVVLQSPPQPPLVRPRVDERRGDRPMAQRLLDDEEVLGLGVDAQCEGVAQLMRMHRVPSARLHEGPTAAWYRGPA